MAKRVEAIVDPGLLVWARKKAGLTLEVAAKKADTSPDRLTAWEAGERRPSVKQLRKLARQRRLALFYLPGPPTDFPPINDYRRARGDEARQPSPELLAEIETARERREIALELLAAGGDTPSAFSLRASIDEDPELLGATIRRVLAVDIATQREWPDHRATFNGWRLAIEALGFLALQMTEVELDEARGFSLAERTLPVVVANNADLYQARSFSLMHELVHVALQASGICDLRYYGRIEPFCNHVAGAVLVPASELCAEPIVRHHGSSLEWSDSDLRGLGFQYGVSREVVLRRLLILGRTDRTFYRRTRARLEAEYKRNREAREKTPTHGVPPPTKALIRSGYFFAHLVLSSHSHRVITASDVADYLGVRFKHVPKIEQSIFPRLAG